MFISLRYSYYFILSTYLFYPVSYVLVFLFCYPKQKPNSILTALVYLNVNVRDHSSVTMNLKEGDVTYAPQ